MLINSIVLALAIAALVFNEFFAPWALRTINRKRIGTALRNYVRKEGDR